MRGTVDTTITWIADRLDAIRDRIGEHGEVLNAWMARHEDTADLVTVWGLVVIFAVLLLVEVGTWAMMRGTRDRTSVGVWLKRKKLGYAALAFGMAALYGVTLWLFYSWAGAGGINVWDRMALRVVVFGGGMGAAISGLGFIRAFRQERKNLMLPDADPNLMAANRPDL